MYTLKIRGLAHEAASVTRYAEATGRSTELCKMQTLSYFRLTDETTRRHAFQYYRHLIDPNLFTNRQIGEALNHAGEHMHVTANFVFGLDLITSQLDASLLSTPKVKISHRDDKDNEFIYMMTLEAEENGAPYLSLTYFEIVHFDEVKYVIKYPINKSMSDLTIPDICGCLRYIGYAIAYS